MKSFFVRGSWRFRGKGYVWEGTICQDLMNEPKRQHLVPRCYLKKFGTNQKEKWFVDAYDKTKDSQIFPVNVNNICVEREFYTVENLPDDKKRFIEHMFASTIEKDYGEVYEALIKNKEMKLSQRLRVSLIRFVVSQFFRTSKFTNNFNKFWNNMLENGYSQLNFKRGIHKINFEGGESIDFKDKTLEQVKKEQAQQNKEYINLTNLDRIYYLTQRRLKDKIMVQKMHSSVKLITSDNPVEFGKFVYDPTVFIRMPLNENHFLTLIPSDKSTPSDSKIVTYGDASEEESWMLGHFNNVFQIENAERYIIGKQKNLEDALTFYRFLNIDDFENRCKEIGEKQRKKLDFLEKFFVRDDN